MRPSVRRLGQRLRPEGAPPPAGAPRLRKGTVVSEASGMVTLTLAGDELELPKLAHVGPLEVGDTVWILAQDSNPWLVVGREATSTELPKCQISSTTSRSTTAGAGPIIFDWAGAAVDFDTGGMADIAGDRITVARAGVYLVGCTMRHVGAVAGTTIRTMDLVKNGSLTTANRIVRSRRSSGSGEYFTPSIPVLAAGEGVGVAVGSTDQALNVTWNDDATTPARLWVAYLW